MTRIDNAFHRIDTSTIGNILFVIVIGAIIIATIFEEYPCESAYNWGRTARHGHLPLEERELLPMGHRCWEAQQKGTTRDKLLEQQIKEEQAFDEEYLKQIRVKMIVILTRAKLVSYQTDCKYMNRAGTTVCEVLEHDNWAIRGKIQKAIAKLNFYFASPAEGRKSITKEIQDDYMNILEHVDISKVDQTPPPSEYLQKWYIN